MTALIARLEAATAGSRELDEDVHVAVYPDLRDHADGSRKIGVDHGFPRYTTSIDAALTLVPEGWTLHTLGAEVDCWRAWLWCPANAALGAKYRGKSKTPALALCIAALKARSAP